MRRLFAPWLVLLLLGLGSAGCLTPFPGYCSETEPCTDPSATYCDLNGDYAPGGHGHVCVPSPFDGGLPDGGSGDSAPGADGSADGGVPPPVPQLLAPANGAFTGTVFSPAALRPTFRWLTALGATRYEIQVDDSCPVFGFSACAFPSPEQEATIPTGLEWRPSVPLPAAMTQPVGRRYFWRVRSCNDMACSAWSAVRYVSVGRQKSDFNGDGIGDRLIGAFLQNNGAAGEGNAFLYFGRLSWTVPSTIQAADVLLDNPTNMSGQFGAALAGVGDVDGDGYSDLVVGAYGLNTAYLYRGRPMWPMYLATPDVTIPKPGAASPSTLFTQAVSGGDVNGDGYSDFLLSSRQESAPEMWEGNAYLYLGRAMLPATLASAEITFDSPVDQAQGYFGTWLSCAGDLNGDGLADIVVGAPGVDNPEQDEGAAYVYFGKSTWGAAPLLVDTPDIAVDNPTDNPMGAIGALVDSGGDLNGDGFDDLALGSDRAGAGGRGEAYLYFGRYTWPGVVETADTTIGAPLTGSATDESFGAAVISGDVNGDGMSDLLVSDSRADNGDVDEGSAFIYFGRASWPASLGPGTADVVLDNPRDQAGSLMSFVSGAGDFNGDGFVDVTVGAPQLDNPEMNEGNVFIWLGRGTWPPIADSCDLTLDNPADQASGDFGLGTY